MKQITLAALLISFFAIAVANVSAQDDNPFALEKPKPLPAGMKGSNPNDPRSKLKAGMYDAGEAAMGIKHVALLKKPAAFDIGTDPEGPLVSTLLRAMGVPDPKMVPPQFRIPSVGMLVANSDLAFQGNNAFVGNFYGVNIYDISDAAKAKLLTSIVCPGGQGDVTVYKNLMFMSVEMPNGRIDCGTQGFPSAGAPPERGKPDVQKDRFRGIRIFDISDISNPKQVGAVQTCRGSHTKDNANVYIYNSGASFVRPDGELAGCSNEPPEKDPNTSKFSIDIIKVPLAAPQTAKIVASPRLFAEGAKLNALTDGGSHDNPGGRVEASDHCHDITAYPELGLAAGACSGNGILLDIREPANPKRIDAVNDKNYAYWHSASFSNDGKKVIYTDEWGGGGGPRCRETDPTVWGANALFNLEGNKLKFANYYKLPAAQTAAENCVAHNGSLIPVPGRDLKVQAWYQGGISIMDFTDPANPVEVGYFDRGPIDANTLVMGGSWSAYWYNGHIYSSEIARGLDIFELVPSQYISQNEIDAAKQVTMSALNVQTQQMMSWPKTMTTAKAYIDQLERSKGLESGMINDLRKAIDNGDASKRAKELEKQAKSLDKNAGNSKNAADASRMRALAEIFRSPAA
jgi:hypothetical protein